MEPSCEGCGHAQSLHEEKNCSHCECEMYIPYGTVMTDVVLTAFISKPLVVHALQIEGLAVQIPKVYAWLASKTNGIFDGQDIPLSYGVSINPDTGYIILARPEGMYELVEGDWVLFDTEGFIHAISDEELHSTFELKS